MPTTPNGTTYTQQSTTLPGGDQAGLVLPSKPDGWVVVYTHGNQGLWNQFYSAGEWAGLRNWLMDRGATVVETAGAGNDWGGVASRASYEQGEAWARTYLQGIGVTPKRTVVLARSMGGLVGYWLATRSAFAGRVAGLIVNSGTTDLTRRYAVATGTDLANLNAAYGLPGSTKNTTLFAERSAGHDPMLADPADWSGAKVMQLYGSADTTVVPQEHALAWWTKYRGVLHPASRIDERPGGDHSPSNGSYLQVAQMAAFLIDLGVGAPDPPAEVFSVLAAYSVGAGRKLYAIDLNV